MPTPKPPIIDAPTNYVEIQPPPQGPVSWIKKYKRETDEFMAFLVMLEHHYHTLEEHQYLFENGIMCRICKAKALCRTLSQDFKDAFFEVVLED